jgi:NADPH:quinone reductase-like Zn-dependent oxidoreductase
VAIAWELMFTRALFGTADMDEQGRILQTVARLVDEGELQSTMTTHLGRIEAANLREAHRRLESGHTIGKIVLEGFA